MERPGIKDIEKYCVKYKEFIIKDLFKPLKVGYVGDGKKIGSATKVPDKEHIVPLTCAKTGDNGIMYYGKKGDFITYTNAISVIADGAVSAGLVYAQPEEAGAYSHSYFIKVKEHDVSALTNIYLSAVLAHKIYPKYSRENSPRWNRIENEKVELPAKPDGKPDWNYMHKYMKAKEKTVIKDVIEWKTKEIETLKRIIKH